MPNAPQGEANNQPCPKVKFSLWCAPVNPAKTRGHQSCAGAGAGCADRRVRPGRSLSCSVINPRGCGASRSVLAHLVEQALAFEQVEQRLLQQGTIVA